MVRHQGFLVLALLSTDSRLVEHLQYKITFPNQLAEQIRSQVLDLTVLGQLMAMQINRLMQEQPPEVVKSAKSTKRDQSLLHQLEMRGSQVSPGQEMGLVEVYLQGFR